VQVFAASEPGSPDKPNEDGVVVTAEMVAVLDGATVRTETGCIHGVPWFVENLCGALVKNKALPVAEALAEAITQTAKAHRDTCDLEHPGTPSAALAIIQVRHGSLHYLVLGDVTLVIETTDELQVVTDNRVSATATAERAAADLLPDGSSEKAEALMRMKHAELAARNAPGGFWVAAADSSVVTHALTGQIPLSKVRRAALLTDGAARAVSPFELYGWPDMLAAVCTAGPSELISQVRLAEASDLAGIRWPRNKPRDDATVALAEF
jgi:Protein phosphatase 2C